MRPSPFLQAIGKRITSAKTALEADIALAEKATYLARVQTDSEAETIVKSLHKKYDPSPNITISIWLNLGEGLSIYFNDMGPSALDKVKRAHALSAAAGLKPLQALTSAWLAQLQYMRHDIDSMAMHLAESLALAEPNHHSARSRACLVAAQALYHSGDFELAASWNQQAHLHATEEGDEATLSALIHNMGWLRMLMWRKSVLTGEGNFEQRRHALMGAESTNNFDKLVGSSTLDVLHPLLKAQIFSLQGKYIEALEIYAAHLEQLKTSQHARLDASLLADCALCNASLGNFNEARRQAESSQSNITPSTHIDDEAAIYSQLASIYIMLNDPLQAAHYTSKAALAWAANEHLQGRVHQLLEPFSHKSL